MIIVSCFASVFAKETVLKNDFSGDSAAVEISKGETGKRTAQLFLKINMK